MWVFQLILNLDSYCIREGVLRSFCSLFESTLLFYQRKSTVNVLQFILIETVIVSEKVVCERFAVYFESRVLLYERKSTEFVLQESRLLLYDRKSTEFVLQESRLLLYERKSIVFVCSSFWIETLIVWEKGYCVGFAVYFDWRFFSIMETVFAPFCIFLIETFTL